MDLEPKAVFWELLLQVARHERAERRKKKPGKKHERAVIVSFGVSPCRLRGINTCGGAHVDLGG